MNNNYYLNIDLRNYLANNCHLDFNNPEIVFNHFASIPGQIFRQVKSRVTKKIKLDSKLDGKLEQEYFIKIHYSSGNKINFKEFIKNIYSLNWPFVSNVSAQQEKDAIEALQKLGINTLELAGYIKIKQNSFIITKAIMPSISLDQLCEKYLNYPDYFKLKRKLIKYIAKNTRKLHQNGLNHRDYYLCHYLLKVKDLEINNINTDDIYLIDLHRMQIRKTVSVRYIIKDLGGLLFSARNYKFTRTDYLRFIKYYLNIKSVKKINKSFWSKVIKKAASMREKG
ncbi:MAG: lipopolysaccharide core heptose(I) kinase RfaP [Gammaproteobacteria bacterium]|nr:lipopolysaccharide core heptose(I) kinase RfaP [Gammaproteobacteria bacterium]